MKVCRRRSGAPGAVSTASIWRCGPLAILPWLVLALALGVAAGSARADGDSVPALEVSLLTFGPGDIYWERFGHNAIVIRDPASGEATSYNYGIFDFEEDDFFFNFLRGNMRYQIAADDADDDIAYYVSTGRAVVEQKLRFTAAQAQALRDYLETNLLPENRHYRYDYFTSNCSTKVRDALDHVLGGPLRQQLTSPSRGFTYRLLADALTRPDPFLMGVIDIGLGPFADQRLSFWKDSFVPMQLMAHLRDVSVTDDHGLERPLVLDEQRLASPIHPDPPALPPDLRWPFFGTGIALGVLFATLDAARRRAWARIGFSSAALLFTLICATFGLIQLGLWAFTDHRSAWANENLLVFSPLCLLLLPTWWRSARPDWTTRAFDRGLAIAVAVLAAFALFSKILSSFPQDNLAWILLLLPTHLVLARSAIANANPR
jgi:hypothetical protein